MLRVVMEIKGVAMAKSPREVMEEYVLSPKLHKTEGHFPMNYNHEESVGGKPVITVHIVEAKQP